MLKRFVFVFFAFILFTALIFKFVTTTTQKKITTKNTCVSDLQKIRKNNELRVTIIPNSLSYYIIQGQPYGFQYELVKVFARDLGINLKINVTNDYFIALNRLYNCETDIICGDFPIITSRKQIGDFAISEPIYYSKLVLVQKIKNQDSLIKTTSELHNKFVVLPRYTLYKYIVSHFIESSILPQYIHVKEQSSEQIIDAIAEGKIEYTIAEEYLANYQKKFYRNIDVSVSLSDSLAYGWLFRSNTKQLLLNFNEWIKKYSKTKEFKLLCFRYFRQQLVSEKRNSEYFSIKNNKISPYDGTVKKASEKIGWDWRLLSALIYEESQFKHDLVSPAGAFGIMQFVQTTAEIYGVDTCSTPEEHIMAGAKYIKSLEKHFENIVPDKNERAKFVIASYNIGPGHILDAIALARKYKKDVSKWDNVAYFLKLKHLEKYYTDEVVKLGFIYGKKTVLFVKEVMDRYEHYKNHYPEK